MIAFTKLSLTPSNLDEYSKAPGMRPYWRGYLPVDQRPTMRINGGGHGLSNEPSFATVRRTRIAAANEDLRQVFSWSGGSKIDELQEDMQNSRTPLSHPWIDNFGSLSRLANDDILSSRASTYYFQQLQPKYHVMMLSVWTASGRNWPSLRLS